jgi:hypothetical protein
MRNTPILAVMTLQGTATPMALKLCHTSMEGLSPALPLRLLTLAKQLLACQVLTRRL